MMSCASSQFENQPPFPIEKVVYNINDQFYTIQIISDQNITTVPTIVYFRDKFSSNIKTDGNQLNIIIPRKKLANIVMHKDPKKEFGNTIEMNDNKKFSLKEDEIVLGFGQKDAIKFYKIEGTQQ